LLLAGAIAVGTWSTAAHAVTAVEHARTTRRSLVVHIHVLRKLHARQLAEVRLAMAPLERLAGDGSNGERVRTLVVREVAKRLLDRERRRRARSGDRHRARLRALRERLDRYEAWLDTYAIFRVCPVPGFTTIHDDFGEIVRLPKIPIHVHQGNDIEAPAGAAIFAPFDGYVSSSRSRRGGIEVRVSGDRGHVYNAHLSAVVRWGWVPAGAVIGYVGMTGNATAPHDHLEWHPNGGSAVDPHELLVFSCVDVD
jgi:murein DD-endopeptidase MepM/ murein hydrolase activator NlpD